VRCVCERMCERICERMCERMLTTIVLTFSDSEAIFLFRIFLRFLLVESRGSNSSEKPEQST
jgi:hypothetical protein